MTTRYGRCRLNETDAEKPQVALDKVCKAVKAVGGARFDHNHHAFVMHPLLSLQKRMDECESLFGLLAKS